MSDPDAAPIDRPTPGRFLTFRSLAIGSVLCVGLALVVPWNDLVLQNTQLYNNFLPPVVTLVLLLFGLALNPLLGRHRLHSTELVVITAMLLALGGVVSSGLARYLPTTIAGSGKLLESKPNLQKLREDLPEGVVDQRRTALLAGIERELAGQDQDGDGRVTAAESDLDVRFARIDTDGDGVVSAEELLADRLAADPALLPTWRWPVHEDLYLGIPATGPIRSGDPEYQLTVDGYLSGLGDQQQPRVQHRSLVSWTDATGTSHGPLPALGGSVADSWRAEGLPFLDLDDPATGGLLLGRPVGTSREGLTITAIEPPGVNWEPWIDVLWDWLPLLLGAITVMIAMAGLVRRQWIDNERLTYPIAQVFHSLIEQPSGGHRFSALFRNRGFWVGLLIVAIILSWRALHQYGHLPIDFKLEWRLDEAGQPFHGEFWAKAPMSWGLYRPAIYFSIAAIVFFLTTEISFSLWFWFIITNIVGLILIDQSVPVKAKHFGDASVGGMAMLCLLIIWFGRQYYLRVVIAACSRRGDPGVREAVPYLYALLLGACLMGAFFLVAGATPLHALLVVLLFMGVMLVFARLVAEAGLPFLQMPWASYPNAVIFSITGYALPAAALLPLALIGTTLLADPRESLMPYAVNADYLGHKNGLKPRRVSLLMGTVAIVGAVLACGALVYWFTTGPGATKDAWPSTLLDRDAFKLVATGTHRELTAQGAEINADAATTSLTAYGIGGAGVGLLGMARLLWAWWPIHPIGIIVMASYPLQRVWFSIFLGWLAKLMVMRYGGTGVYQRLKPAAIGLIAGEAIVTLIFILVAVVITLMGGYAQPFKALPG